MRVSIVFAVIAVIPSSIAWAEQHPPQKDVNQEVRRRCQEEVRKVCTFIIPSTSAIQSCVAEHKEKFSEQCRTILLQPRN